MLASTCLYSLYAWFIYLPRNNKQKRLAQNVIIFPSLTGAVCEEVGDVTLSVTPKTREKRVVMCDAPSREDVDQFAILVGR